MSSEPMEIIDGVWRWTARHPEWHPREFGQRVASFAVLADGVTLLIDPLLPEDDATAVIDVIDAVVTSTVVILVTIPYHARSAEPLAARYRATIYGPPRTVNRLTSRRVFHPTSPGETLPGGVRAFAIGSPRRSEQPLWLPSHRALAFGDAVVGVSGELRVWAQAPVDDRARRFYRERFNPTLQPLLALDPACILVTHGEPMLHDGRAALAAALAADPWTSRT